MSWFLNYIFVVDFQAFRDLASKSRLLEKYGEKKIILSTANTHSYEKGNEKLMSHIIASCNGMTQFSPV
jgi:hypothetical protein